MRELLCAAAVVSELLAQSPQGKPATSPPGLHIVVIAGEDAVNVVQQKTAVSPIVEVRDRNDQPVTGAIVTFTISSTQNATFGGVSTLSLTTNAAGRAAVAALTPTGTGAVQINVAAVFQGQTATATIAQTNFATAAQAAASGASASGGSAGGSGGGVGAGTLTVIGAGVAAAGAGALALALALKKPDAQPLLPITAAFRAEPAIAMLATYVFFYADVGGSLDPTEPTITWDFGDGTTLTRPPPQPGFTYSSNHIYLSTGNFTVRVTISNPDGRSAQAQVGVTIKSMTGRWTLDPGPGVFDFVQTGTSITGTFAAASVQNSGTLSGTVGAGPVSGFENFAPGVTFTITANSRAQTTFVGSVRESTSANLIVGGIGAGSGTVVWTLTRQ